MTFSSTELWNSPAFVIFLQEILVMLLIIFIEKIKEIIEKRKISVPESFVPSMKYLLVTLMPAIALFHALIESHLEIYYAVIVFVIEFVIVYMYLRLKYEEIPHTISFVFGGLVIFLGVAFGLTYYLLR